MDVRELFCRPLISANHTACSRLVLEITEHLSLGKIDDLRPVVEGYHSRGVRIAMDETGCGYADLNATASIRADIVKLCITLIRSAEQHRDVRAAIAEVVNQAHSHGTLVLAEGVGTIDQACMLSELGIGLAQSWLYGKPFPETELETRAHTVVPYGSMYADVN